MIKSVSQTFQLFSRFSLTNFVGQDLLQEKKANKEQERLGHAIFQADNKFFRKMRILVQIQP